MLLPDEICYHMFMQYLKALLITLLIALIAWATFSPPFMSFFLVAAVLVVYFYGTRTSFIPIIGAIIFAFTFSIDDTDFLKKVPFLVVMTGVTILIGYIRNLNFRLGHLAQIVDSSTDAIISKDLDGIVLSWNKGAEEIFGWTAKEMIGQSIRKIIPETRQKEEDFILDNIRHGRPVSHLETVRRAKNGQLLDVFLSVSPVRNQYGKVVGASKMLRNISERKLSEARFQAQFKGTPVPIFSWKLTDGDFILTEFNDAAEQITHGKIHELMHRKASEVYANTPEVLELMWKTFNTKSTIRREGPFRFLTTGETRFLDVSFIYVHPDFVMIHTEAKRDE